MRNFYVSAVVKPKGKKITTFKTIFFDSKEDKFPTIGQLLAAFSSQSKQEFEEFKILSINELAKEDFDQWVDDLTPNTK